MNLEDFRSEWISDLRVAAEANQSDPEVLKILSDYKAAFDTKDSGTLTAPAATSAVSSEQTQNTMTPTATPEAAVTAAAAARFRKTSSMK